MIAFHATTVRRWLSWHDRVLEWCSARAVADCKRSPPSAPQPVRFDLPYVGGLTCAFLSPGAFVLGWMSIQAPDILDWLNAGIFSLVALGCVYYGYTRLTTDLRSRGRLG